ncbi:PREDICTED: succinate dehydrogenase assembly factor 3, mitochondrial isoform X2 [Nicrophorus vespilloides]|nr:PREDICTED: succinate dehydrogenase assembly factor 3, mitochondrial isoform X2 [Nicrophorus vespilloides]
MTSQTHIQKVRFLYKTIFKLHKGLPEELQILGNSYTRDEFKRHKKCTNEEAAVFMSEWTNYAITIAEQLGLKGPKTGTKKLGKPLNECELELFRDEQLHQLYELMVTAKSEKTDKEM